MKKILISLAAILVVVGGIAALSAFEAHIINVTAHIENALSISPQGINFGTVFPQEYMEKPFTVSLSESFMNEDRVDDVEYKLVQKEKPWTLNFGGDDVNAHNRSLIFVDPDPGKGEGYNIAGGVLTITTGNDIEDLFGQNEVAADWTAPRMVIPMGGNFTIETKVTANPMDYPGAPDDNAYQSGGILVYESDGNVIRLELTSFTGLGPANVVYMESQMVAVKTGKGWDGIGGADTIWLRLSRNDNTFTGEYSLDGIVWNLVTTQEGNFINGNIGGQPKVGLAVTDNNEDGSNSSFSADFDYVTFNGDYLSLCKFLSKMNDETDGQEEQNDTSHPSYFVPADPTHQVPASCLTEPAPDATGRLSKIIGDIVDTWNVDLKVPPVVGNVGQDWPESCSQFVVPENEADYGCDIWVEVTDISERPE
ncbi:MAG: hypothetical protein A3A94_00195 [Candidatus Portnoybacteria bacterium RIFCSPLOWO2_01_FULL_43_11]|uniref:Beta-xylosidase C-terminal Concanavalin A-like domain-containing protein n=3 Tax=Candidatus Portnoyibacteriota TaxID=1817913 RepID=A0A1G2FCN5_9BACT|nr:MAG: hypothetical protein A2815_02305 [Candidatus Portnoybacteria bacterium RIFCSPHIGHO2_01_FULL_40_12b]OGZ38969.1 MAG: hypothetical protein A3A94_00195 [Candidatus Portnoybacteria bacterium RIFCSPLOWO2_01_FULL_43_11]OGZ40500.1 MAG: hypothetical protein A3I20_00420 [Candidatus Portnoybacteria bacterium RIFCSPLOWO2_02_FULL_40_15]